MLIVVMEIGCLQLHNVSFSTLIRTSYTDWQKEYETLAEMVVPRSTK